MSYLAYGIISRFRSVSTANDAFESIMPPSGSILKSIAVPRVSGTTSNARVREFIKSQFKSSLWDIEEDYHVIDSPLGKDTPFTNLIITHKLKNNSNGDDRIIVAAHYDSKLLEADSLEVIPEGFKSEFIGATDSAWACSLIIFIAKALERSNLKRNFQLIFFDGEEAVRHWSPSDSLYGSRALASKWSKLPSNHPNSLHKIELMVLLDLLGSKDGTNFYSFTSENSKVDLEFKKLIEIEGKHFLQGKKFFHSSAQFKNLKGQAVEDDHTPFLPFGVPILHLIPLPFPDVWHTQQDTIETLDEETCKKLTKIIFEYIKEKIVRT